jgi:two-component system sensor kinase FixL
MRNITGRREVETDRHQTGAKLRAVLDHAVDGLITIDARGNMESFNPACKRIFGYESEEVIGKNIKMLMPEPYRGGHDGYLSHYATTGEAQIIGTAGREVSGRRKDGSVFPMDLSVCVFELGDGKHYSGIIRDITARKAVEAERERIAAELARYTRALERSNQELDAFAYAASHDLKAPLRVIHNASMWIEEDLAGNLTAEIRENMILLRSRVRRMDRLLDDLLEYSRIGRETDSSHAEAISGTVLMENILGLISPPQGFNVSATATFAGIEVYRMPLQQILINLISNAIKHHDKKAGRIEVSVEDLGPMFRFRVKDDGPGISAQYHEQVFKMFQTLKPRDQVEGSGMGLAMVRKNVDVAGGELHLESALGQGSTFSFTWPKQQINMQNIKHRFPRVEQT